VVLILVTLPYSLEDTIVAIATPPGQAGVGIVRLSGVSALPIAINLFSKKNMPHGKLVYGHVIHPTDQSIIDDGYAVYFKAPKSYTGQNVVEFHLHGSMITLSQTVSQVVALGGRQALPGEFTQRAFLNDKLDLIQAEGVADLIHAQSLAESKLARALMRGRLSDQVHAIKAQLINVLAELEAFVDFPEEDIALARKDFLSEQLELMIKNAQSLLDTYRKTQTIKDGFRICFVGKPNAGKSSLFNALLSNDRSIVTDIPGTTRDHISEVLFLEGRKVLLIDTAGLRDNTHDPIERLGMEKTKTVLEDAHMVCVVSDATTAFDGHLLDQLDAVDKQDRVLILNKIDLTHEPPMTFHPFFKHVVALSALKDDGVDVLINLMKQKVLDAMTLQSHGGVSNDRQRCLLEMVKDQLEMGHAALVKNDSPEFVSFEVRRALQALDSLLGKVHDFDQVYDEIFSKFCIGK